MLQFIYRELKNSFQVVLENKEEFEVEGAVHAEMWRHLESRACKRGLWTMRLRLTGDIGYKSFLDVTLIILDTIL